MYYRSYRLSFVRKNCEILTVYIRQTETNFKCNKYCQNISLSIQKLNRLSLITNSTYSRTAVLISCQINILRKTFNWNKLVADILRDSSFVHILKNYYSCANTLKTPCTESYFCNLFLL